MPFMGPKWIWAQHQNVLGISANDVGQLVSLNLKTSNLNLSKATYLDSSFALGVTLSTKPRR